MVRARDMHGEKRNTCSFGGENLKARVHLKEPGINGIMILKRHECTYDERARTGISVSGSYFDTERANMCVLRVLQKTDSFPRVLASFPDTEIY
jgi:hypothetical protein